MKKGNLTGWKDVFNFTLVQTLKSKAFVVSFVILLALSMISMPVISKITSRGKSDVNMPSPIKKVYFNNKTNLPNMDFRELQKDQRFSHITFEAISENYDAVAARIEEQEKESIILTLGLKEGKYSLDFVKASSGPIKESNLKLLSDSIVPQFEAFKLNSLGIRDEQLALIQADIKTKVSTANVNGMEIINEDTSISQNEYWFIYGILFIVLIVNVLASTQIASSIVTEKSTRVIEYLLTSVKPLAIIAGKITGMLTAVILQVVSAILILFVSNKVSQALFSNNGESVLSQYIPKGIFQNLNMVNLIICLVLIALGMIFYAALAGLAGATVSRIEELNEGLVLFTFTNLIGAYIGIGSAVMLMAKGINWFVIFSFLLPLSSPFVLPGAILIGKASIPIAAAAIALQVIFIVLLFKFVARVYETLILHNGSKISIKELIKLSKTV